MEKYSWLFVLTMFACTSKHQTSVTLNHQEKEATQDSYAIPKKNYMVVEFYKGVSQTQAQQVLDSLNCTYQWQSGDREDDSHQNQVITSGVGHKYLLTFYDPKKQAAFLKKTQIKPAIFRIWDEHNQKSYTYNKNNALVVVFKLKQTEDNCNHLLQQWNCTYYSGMDSGKGKKYFYSTGPKFIVNFPNKTQAQAFIDEHKKMPEIHEIYPPDWGIFKD
ncbi:hypothetical protein [uncultured Microscilla sp.]|uniref:hypothetical protein n=1 Tax=uncultured Microscilla sp. TaxID=432653 RepID=UPI0026070EFC|nr:hypothetical protein [uncultured Microscilla sp.]